MHIVAHDLKGPANNLERLLEAYQEEVPIPSRDYLVTLVAKEVQPLTGAVQSLLHVLHTQHGAAVAVPKMVALAEGYHGSSRSGSATTPAARPAYGRLQRGVHCAFPTRVSLKRILKNLVSNAFKYRAPERVPAIQVRSHCQAVAVVLTVADKGRAIDLAHDRKRLSQPFTRLTADGEGADLGLHLI